MAGIEAISNMTPSKGKRTKNQDRWLLKSIDNVILIQEKKITAINTLKNSIMQDLLSGRKRVNV